MDLVNPDKEYHHTDHLVYSCLYHVIYCTKYRRKVLDEELQKELKEKLPTLADEVQAKIVSLETMPDHVHLIIDCNPRFGITRTVKHLKGKTSRYLRDKFPHLKSRIPTLWTRSCFISTVGSVSLKAVKKYIEDQKKK